MGWENFFLLCFCRKCPWPRAGHREVLRFQAAVQRAWAARLSFHGPRTLARHTFLLDRKALEPRPPPPHLPRPGLGPGRPSHPGPRPCSSHSPERPLHPPRPISKTPKNCHPHSSPCSSLSPRKPPALACQPHALPAEFRPLSSWIYTMFPDICVAPSSAHHTPVLHVGHSFLDAAKILRIVSLEFLCPYCHARCVHILHGSQWILVSSLCEPHRMS